MSKMVLLNTRLFANAADLTSVATKAELSAEYEEKDVTTFGSAGWKEFIAGLGSAKVDAEGFWEAGDASKVDDNQWLYKGAAGPWTICPVDANVGSLAYIVNAVQTDYSVGGSVGDVAPWKASAISAWPVARGVVAHPPGTARTATGTGSSVQLGAVPTGKSLYVALHVLSATGTTPSITVAVEADNATGFPSPVTVATFTAASAVGGQILRVTGANPDDWYRVKWTISGTTPSFLFAAAFGIA